VLRSVSDDPFGSYEDMGMLHTGDDLENPKEIKWSIDLTPLEHQGKLYAIWSGWQENRDTDKTEQHLYIAAMENPFTINGPRVKLSSPDEDWETGGELDLQEGPQVLKNGSKVFIIYSTRESWRHFYRLGQLELINENADPMNPGNWLKKGPVFEGTEEVLG
jgi:GH43 family beta-xylosidase